MDKYKVTAIVKNAAGVAVSVESIDGSLLKEFLITTESFAKTSVDEGDIFGDDIFDILETEAAYCRAMARVVKILSYSSQSKAALVRKLMGYGFTKEISTRASLGAEANGDLNEVGQAEHLCDYYLRHKYWGKKRMAAELLSRGYEKDIVKNIISEIPGERFVANLEKLISKRPVPDDKTERDRYISALSRMGYSLSEIFDAINKS